MSSLLLLMRQYIYPTGLPPRLFAPLSVYKYWMIGDKLQKLCAKYSKSSSNSDADGREEGKQRSQLVRSFPHNSICHLKLIFKNHKVWTTKYFFFCRQKFHFNDNSLIEPAPSCHLWESYKGNCGWSKGTKIKDK